jgi:dsDNA-binding SOS-regulon protein
MVYNDYLKQIIDFNGDKDVIALREKFNRPSFFEIISKERSETTYSAFLKWLFQENNLDKDACNPLALLLDVLVRRSEEQKAFVDTILSTEVVKRSIVTRTLNIRPVKVETEKYVSNLAQAIIDTPCKVVGELVENDLKKIAAKSQDRIDLFVDCEIDCDNLKAKRMQIVIENKIDSAEGGRKTKKNAIGVVGYDNATQTKRYYLGTKYTPCDANGKPCGIDEMDVLQIYVYLTPQKPYQDGCSDNHFIQINYQDIVDNILMPMLASSSLSIRSRFFLEEFLNQLVFPSLDGSMILPSIAIGKENSEELNKIWKKYQPLLTHAAIAASEVSLWMVDDTYYDHQPRTELLEALLPKCIQPTGDIINGKWKKGMQYSKMKALAEQYGIMTNQVDLSLNDDAQELLSSFWMKNQRLLTAVINGMESSERIKVEALLTQSSKRDTTRYNVYYNDSPLNRKTPLGKAQAAFAIINKWASIRKGNRKDVTIEILNNTFPIECNPYYERGQWFKYLFYETKGSYEYDGKKADGPVQGNWDFDKKGRFIIDTTDGKQVTMLKMWRKESLETLVEWVKKKKLFSGTLDVVPVE